MWKEYVAQVTDAATFSAPATAHRRSEVETSLGVMFPHDLRELLRETNGVVGEYDLGLVWDVDRIESDNLNFRSNADFAQIYMPFEPLLFFGDAGNGDQFAYVILSGVVRRQDIFVWNHEEDSRSWVAPSLREYFEWGTTGRLTY
jgi:hypothetical protein